MIKSIELTNFRKHTATAVQLSSGLQVIRGFNEAGKSTLIEGILYALFGSKILRTTFAETVTWGKPESSLKARVVLFINGVDYIFTRSKAGAECAYGEKLVTGQNEVSDFASALIGAPANAAANLMLASQGNLQGSLSAGPKATAEMIEKLADFDLFEVVVEKMQKHLILGSVDPATSRYEKLKEELESLGSEVKPDHTERLKVISETEAELKDLNDWITNTGEPANRDARVKLETADMRIRAQKQNYDSLQKAITEHKVHQEQHKLNVERAKDRPDPAEIKAITEQISSASTAESSLKVYNQLLTLNRTYPEVAWEGDFDSLMASINDTQAKANRVRVQISDLKGEIRTLEATKVTSSVCGFCDQDISQFPSVLEKNRKIDERVAVLSKNISDIESELPDLEGELDILRGVVNTSAKFSSFIQQNGKYLEVDYNHVPPMIEWKGEKPSAVPVSVQDLRAKVSELESKLDVSVKAEAKAAALADAMVEDLERIKQLQERYDNGKEVIDIDSLKAEVEKTDRALRDAKYTGMDLNDYLKKVKEDIKAIDTGYELAITQRKKLVEAVAEAKTQVDTIIFNNNLLKKVRNARPIIADKLWNSVLSSVSVMFSQMRGVNSVVAKGKDGFTVNGATFASLSGSTLDLLGLAIRVALVKTFLPSTPFMVLDEPFAACDEDRSTAMLGFIAAAGFGQTILITHEENSEAVADNLINM